MIEPGSPAKKGASVGDGGTNFALHAPAATRVELCLFDDTGGSDSLDLPAQQNGTWHGFLPGCRAGQRYGYRVHGRYAPEEGLRFNPYKLLIDPYTRRLAGSFRWSPAVFDYETDAGISTMSSVDSAPHVPRSVVTDEDEAGPIATKRIPWSQTVIYETNVRGYTMRHPAVDEADRGRFRGLKNGEVLEHLKSLGITSVELMPVFEYVDEHFLVKRGQRNFWGYNTLNFFTPAARYASEDPSGEFREMVNAIHDAGLEVILDVVYNHTSESGGTGPTLCFRGIDNLGYYRVEPDDPSRYINDTGTGNTINTDSPHVRQLIVDSLRYWTTHMGVDGFRFDLATIQGRTANGFDPAHPFFADLSNEPALDGAKLIAEPWDAGPGGYQLGSFPHNWAEWNDKYRDSARRFWLTDANESPEFAKRLHGSDDIFAPGGRNDSASVNFVTAHDGFTLADLVSYKYRHNEANGEKNRDGHAHNFSCNFGAEGDTDDPAILAIRRQQRLNLLATLLLSHGTPMLLGGDELGHSQSGNNNAYAQDNDTGWLDWSGLEDDPEFLVAVQSLIRLRADLTPLRARRHDENDVAVKPVDWLTPDGQPISSDDWRQIDAFSVVWNSEMHGLASPAAILALNSSAQPVSFRLPETSTDWQTRFVSNAREFRPIGRNRWQIPPQSLVCAASE